MTHAAAQSIPVKYNPIAFRELQTKRGDIPSSCYNNCTSRPAFFFVGTLSVRTTSNKRTTLPHFYNEKKIGFIMTEFNKPDEYWMGGNFATQGTSDLLASLNEAVGASRNINKLDNTTSIDALFSSRTNSKKKQLQQQQQQQQQERHNHCKNGTQERPLRSATATASASSTSTSRVSRDSTTTIERQRRSV